MRMRYWLGATCMPAYSGAHFRVTRIVVRDITERRSRRKQRIHPQEPWLHNDTFSGDVPPDRSTSQDNTGSDGGRVRLDPLTTCTVYTAYIVTTNKIYVDRDYERPTVPDTNMHTRVARSVAMHVYDSLVAILRMKYFCANISEAEGHEPCQISMI